MLQPNCNAHYRGPLSIGNNGYQWAVRPGSNANKAARCLEHRQEQHDVPEQNQSEIARFFGCAALSL
jgi:hypothetical protein